MSGPSLGYIAAGIATAVTAIYSPVCAIFVALFSLNIIVALALSKAMRIINEYIRNQSMSS